VLHLDLEILSLAPEDDDPLWELRNAIVGSPKSSVGDAELMLAVERLIDARLLELSIGSMNSKVKLTQERSTWIGAFRDPRFWTIPDDPHSDQLFVAATATGSARYFGDN